MQKPCHFEILHSQKQSEARNAIQQIKKKSVNSMLNDKPNIVIALL